VSTTVGQCGEKEEQQISVLGNSKFNMVTWCQSFNRLEVQFNIHLISQPTNVQPLRLRLSPLLSSSSAPNTTALTACPLNPTSPAFQSLFACLGSRQCTYQLYPLQRLPHCLVVHEQRCISRVSDPLQAASSRRQHSHATYIPLVSPSFPYQAIPNTQQVQ